MDLGARILVLGPSGAGKSTLATQLGALTGLPVVHLDRLFWNPGWVETPPAQMDQKVTLAAGEKAWIMDGNYTRTLPPRLILADSVIYLDLNRYTCLFRVIRRWIKHFGKTRPDMGRGCPEKIDRAFLRFVWTFPKHSREKILHAIAEHGRGKNIYILKGQRQIRAFVKTIRTAYPPAVHRPA